MTVKAFEDIARANPYRPKGIFYSEMYLFLKACEDLRINLVIESGVKFGMSTCLLKAAFPGETISVDRDPLQITDLVPFMQGDAMTVIPALIKTKDASERIAVLIDGPKGEQARTLRDICLTYPQVKCVGIHGAPVGEQWRHSHAPSFRRTAKRLDAFVSPAFREAYPDGAGMGIWLGATP